MSKSNCCNKKCKDCVEIKHCHLENRYNYSEGYMRQQYIIFDIPSIDDIRKDVLQEYTKSFIESVVIYKNLEMSYIWNRAAM